MTLVPWRHKGENVEDQDPPERSLMRLRDEIDALFERFFKVPFGGGPFQSLAAGLGGGLRADLAESPDDVTVSVELPGVDPKDIDVTVTGYTLTVRGEKRKESEEKKRDYHYVERQFGSFQRSLQLPATVDPDKVDATFRDGVLTITLPKHPQERPRRIPVRGD